MTLCIPYRPPLAAVIRLYFPKSLKQIKTNLQWFLFALWYFLNDFSSFTLYTSPQVDRERIDIIHECKAFWHFTGCQKQARRDGRQCTWCRGDGADDRYSDVVLQASSPPNNPPTHPTT